MASFAEADLGKCIFANYCVALLCVPPKYHLGAEQLQWKRWMDSVSLWKTAAENKLGLTAAKETSLKGEASRETASVSFLLRFLGGWGSWKAGQPYQQLQYPVRFVGACMRLCMCREATGDLHSDARGYKKKSNWTMVSGFRNRIYSLNVGWKCLPLTLCALRRVGWFGVFLLLFFSQEKFLYLQGLEPEERGKISVEMPHYTCWRSHFSFIFSSSLYLLILRNTSCFRICISS